ncbi:probable F-box protein At3g61730 [Chenopodium quinoa]|uniref:Uncharacterized protein n=1 Tax=Chenopodium quinoa TaxID=63459 RepID=A0A803KZM7_CHEQI|nr:probable F-box protein At3g61730 [Chenopodium quinoa]
MGKRLKRTLPFCSCSSPRLSSFFSLRASFAWFEDDVWIEIAKYLDGRSLVMLATTCKWFYKTLSEECVWKFACLRDLAVPDPGDVSFKWKKLYASAFDGSHSYLFRQQEKHIDWIRIGAFFLESSAAIVTEKLTSPPRKIPQKETLEQMLQSLGLCVLTNIKTGIWIADLQLVRCPVCDLNTCDGTMQTLDARHFELFMNESYHDGSWDYSQIGSHETKKHVDGASGAIFDVKHLKDASSAEIFNPKSWIGKQNDWQPKAKLSLHAVAVNTNLQLNDGINVKFHVMRAGTDGQIMAIRVSQQLL